MCTGAAQSTYQSKTHSHTLPLRSHAPYPLRSNELRTSRVGMGRVRSEPISQGKKMGYCQE